MIIPFTSSEDDAFDEFLDAIPDVGNMDAEALKTYHGLLQDAIAKLDKAEPRNEASEAYDLWAEKHEDLEDLLDEILDRMEELK